MSTVSAEELDALEAALLEELERKKAATAAPVATPATRTRQPEPTRSYAKQTARTAATAPRKFAPKAATLQVTPRAAHGSYAAPTPKSPRSRTGSLPSTPRSLEEHKWPKLTAPWRVPAELMEQ